MKEPGVTVLTINLSVIMMMMMVHCSVFSHFHDTRERGGGRCTSAILHVNTFLPARLNTSRESCRMKDKSDKERQRNECNV